MKERIKKIIRLTLGWLLLFLGVIGLFLPFLQGILFILGGLAILSTEYTWARRWLIWCKAKFKKKDPNSGSAETQNESRPDDGSEPRGTNEKQAYPSGISPKSEDGNASLGTRGPASDKVRIHGSGTVEL